MNSERPGRTWHRHRGTPALPVGASAFTWHLEQPALAVRRFGLALRVGRVPRRDEKEIGKPVQVLLHLRRCVAGEHERRGAALGAAADGAREVEQRAAAPTRVEHKVCERRQLALELVDPALESRRLRPIERGKLALLLVRSGGEWRGDNRAYVEQPALDPRDLRAQERRVARTKLSRDAERCRQLVCVAERAEDRVGLAAALAIIKRRLALVAAPRVDPHAA
mmetsp:Transcript_1331/g.4348  ORF Transcript_1331/g.4348 Transcript_1331/m.4348 type:complete len:223 (-) Transcript_1331:68-736(-)